MSMLGCVCGHTIRDQSENLPYKGRVLPDFHHDDFFEWMADEIESYVAATRESRTDVWLRDRGYTQVYIDLNLSDANVMHDHIHTRFSELKRDMFECESCGRVLVEMHEGNRFASYAPDNPATSGILMPKSND